MNQVEIVGELMGEPFIGGQGERKYAFFRVKTEEERPTQVDCAAFGDAALAAEGISDHDRIRVKGRIGIKQDRRLSDETGRKIWLMQVVADDISAAPRPTTGDLPF